MGTTYNRDIGVKNDDNMRVKYGNGIKGPY